MAKTHDTFVSEMKIISPELKIVGNYLGARKYILVEDEFGICKSSPTNLLKGKKPTISSAINPIEYLKSQLRGIDNCVDFSGNYVNSSTKIEINTKYGKCLIAPNHLLSGIKPSAQSAINKKEYFIAQAREIHGYKYDYCKADIKVYHAKITIICPKHGMFEQTPSSHLQGHGCKKCGCETISGTELSKRIINIHPNLKILSDLFNTSSRVLVEDKFGVCNPYVSTLLCGKKPSILTAINKADYFKSKLKNISPNIIILDDYVDHKIKVRVLSKYGVCNLTPESLLRGANPTINSAINKTEFFIANCSDVHNNKFNYSKVNYIDEGNNIVIICPEHGEFTYKAGLHLRSVHGCPKCAKSQRGYSRSDFVRITNNKVCTLYIIKCFNDYELFYKIGITSSNIKRRFDGKKSMPYEYELVSKIESVDAEFIWNEEKRLHKLNKDFNYSPKISFAGETECFSRLINQQ